MRKNILIITLTCFFLVISASSLMARPQAKDSWKLKEIAAVENNKSLVHFKWDLVRPPYGELDRISLHRVSQKRHFMGNNKVILMIPGTWQAGGWSELTNPDVNTMLYLANAGYDVYSINFRAQNIPSLDYDQFAEKGVDLSPTTDWTFGVYREDIKAAVEKIKRTSWTQKIFLAGFSRGGNMMYIYANKYQDDLHGLVSLDGGLKDNPAVGPQMDETVYNAVTAQFKSGTMIDPHTQTPFPWVFGLIGVDDPTYASFQLAKVMPHSKYMVNGELPAEFNDLSDYVADKVHQLIIPGLFTNYHGGYIDRDVLVTVINEFDRYNPHRQTLEEGQMMAWDDVPYLDYDDQKTSLPVIAFFSEMMCPMSSCLMDFIPNMTTSEDVTINFLEGYGHMDVLHGKNSATDVKAPLLQWLNDRSQPNWYDDFFRYNTNQKFNLLNQF